MTRVLAIEGLDAGYDGVAVVRGLTLHVDAGEVVALLGPNGAGKTTTLLTVSGLVAPMAGTLDVVGEGPPPPRRPAKVARRGVAHVPEERSVFADLTVRENLRLGERRGRRGGAPEATSTPNEARPTTVAATDLFPALVPLLDRRAGLLSGGEQQMLALARALAGAPRLLLVDELSLGLAPIVVERLLPAVRRAADELGTGVLMVEQHVKLALDVADRAYVMSHGELVVEGSASALAADRDLLASSYLGSEVLDDSS
jgi:branched-chain amino acid transport system ATP-binding protein